MMSLDIKTIESQAHQLRNSGHTDEAESLLELARQRNNLLRATDELLARCESELADIREHENVVSALRRELQDRADHYEEVLRLRARCEHAHREGERERKRGDRWKAMATKLLLDELDELDGLYKLVKLDELDNPGDTPSAKVSKTGKGGN